MEVTISIREVAAPLKVTGFVKTYVLSINLKFTDLGSTSDAVLRMTESSSTETERAASGEHDIEPRIQLNGVDMETMLT